MSVYSIDFEIFWKAYPRKVGKMAAWKAWNKYKPTLNDVLSALEWQRNTKQWKQSGGQFIPHPSTYLNQGRWEDEPEISVTPQRVMGIAPSRSGREMVY